MKNVDKGYFKGVKDMFRGIVKYLSMGHSSFGWSDKTVILDEYEKELQGIPIEVVKRDNDIKYGMYSQKSRAT